MPYFTKQEARAAAQSKRSFTKTFGQIIMESASAAKDSDNFDIFLSHSMRDEELIIGITEILKQRGFSVYVDWIIDPQMSRSSVSKETAEVLRKRMRQSKSLIYVATENSSSSKWMPWELGYFDGYKPGQVAVLPLTDTENSTFPKQEYLGIYPEVTKNTSGNGTKNLYVEDVQNQWMTLEQFGKATGVWRSY